MRARLLGAVMLVTGAAAAIGGPGLPQARAVVGTDAVLVAEGERLWSFEVTNGVVGAGREFLDESEWVNGPPCFLPGDSAHRFYEANDNPDVLFPSLGYLDGDQNPFFSRFSRTGAKQFGDTDPEFPGKVLVDADDHGALWSPERVMLDPAGCTFDNHGNFVGVDVGASHTPMGLDGATPGHLRMFFKASNNPGADFTSSCILGPDLSQPGFPAVDSQNRLYVPETGAGVIWRYALPTSAAGCASVVRERWTDVSRTGLGTPIAITAAPGGGWAVSSVLAPAMIVRLDGDGTLADVLVPPGPDTGSPFGIGFDRNGNLFYADLGLRPFPGGPESPDEPIGPGQDAGSLKMVPAGSRLPVTIASGWNFPDGLTIVPADWLQS